ncbi:hypothetical protein E2C01_071430 [Portunus trituberculatus]|uniref:Uncharacterized protein n=1 Tax=Portunus trituberculatus TaxID=210409 RepID=A0A5B7I3Y4_PORTR|nr:hypothetical protein [Portunus trituberculatus]
MVDLGEPPTPADEADGTLLIPEDSYDVIDGEQRHTKIYKC